MSFRYGVGRDERRADTWKANELEIAILNLFVDIRVRYPNLIVGKLERDTVKRAMEEGITASQVRRAVRVT